MSPRSVVYAQHTVHQDHVPYEERIVAIKHQTTTGTSIDSLSRTGRRALVVSALSGYPIFLGAWFGLPAMGITGVAWAVAVAAIGLATLAAMVALYRFRRSMAQAPEDRLDERQIAVRDHAYLQSYRLFCGGLLLALVAVAIAPDLLDRTLSVTYETIQPLVWAGILYSIILPSAVVAWQEPDLDEA